MNSEVDIKRQLEILSTDKRELLRVNHRWDEQYRQLESMYRRLQDDNLRMQQELESTIYNLKSRIAEFEQNGKIAPSLTPTQHHNYNLLQSQFGNIQKELIQIREANSKLGTENDQLHDDITTLKHKLAEMKAVESSVQQYKNENELLKQQAFTFREDFEKERSDRERLSNERHTMKLKHDNEMSTLQIKLDKLQRELKYYSCENVKLEQQLKLRSSRDSDSYHSYLSTKGFVNATTPPMDPFVEKDEEEELLQENGYQSFPVSLSDRRDLVNGQLHSLQKVELLARDPGNSGKAKSPADGQKAHSSSKFHIPLFSKESKYKCSRCNRKFTDKIEYTDHTTKCIQ